MGWGRAWAPSTPRPPAPASRLPHAGGVHRWRLKLWGSGIYVFEGCRAFQQAWGVRAPRAADPAAKCRARFPLLPFMLRSLWAWVFRGQRLALLPCYLQYTKGTQGGQGSTVSASSA